MSSRPQARLPSGPSPASALGRQRHARLGAAFGGDPAPSALPRPESRLVVVVEPDEHVRMLARLTLGEIAEVVGCDSSEEALSTMRERGGDVVLVYADMHLAGSVSSLDLARKVIDRWPGTHMVLTSGVADLPEGAPAGVGFLPKPWRCADLLDEAQAALTP